MSDPFKQPIATRNDIERHLAALIALDPALGRFAERAGKIPLRRTEPGFAGLARIVNGQLLSVASASAINARFFARIGSGGAAAFLDAAEAELRACGLSAAKYVCLQTLARAELSGELDHDRLARMDGGAAIATLTRFRGVGRWTAEIYLLSALGHPDVFPAGDLALRKMVGQVQGPTDLPSERETRVYAERWAPHRATAARLLWRVFAVQNSNEGIGL